MKDPRNLKEMAENRAEEIDEQWQSQEELVKEKYLERLKVSPRIALLFDTCTIAVGTFWMLFYGFSAHVGVSAIVTVILVFTIYTFLQNVIEVLA